MSARPKSLAGRLTDLLSLALLLAVLYASRFAPRMGDAAVLCALGFLVLAGTLLAEILEVIKLPHLTGYLLAGLIAGPHVLQLIDADSVKRLGPVNTLAL